MPNTTWLRRLIRGFRWIVPVKPELGAIAIGVIGITGVSLVVSGIVKWPFSLVLLTVLYAVIVVASRRLNA
jgi:hypothetical protein